MSESCRKRRNWEVSENCDRIKRRVRLTCRLKSCRILISAGLRPGISSPFLIRRISRRGSISAPTFSRSPRIKPKQPERKFLDCARVGKSETNEASSRSIARDLPKDRGRFALSQSRLPRFELQSACSRALNTPRATAHPLNVSQSFDDQVESAFVVSHSTK